MLDRSLEALIHDNIELLEQGLRVLESVGDNAFSQAHPQVALSGAGAHMRHTYDFYRRLLDGVAEGRVDYDARQRDERMETDAAYTAGKWRELIDEVRALSGTPSSDQELRIKSDAEGMVGDEAPWTRSSLGRELQAVLSHTVHHYALIGIALRLADCDPGPEFGVAPSTLRYWQEQRACAR